MQKVAGLPWWVGPGPPTVLFTHLSLKQHRLHQDGSHPNTGLPTYSHLAITFRQLTFTLVGFRVAGDSSSHQGLLETWLLVSPRGPGKGREGLQLWDTIIPGSPQGHPSEAHSYGKNLELTHPTLTL